MRDPAQGGDGNPQDEHGDPRAITAQHFQRTVCSFWGQESRGIHQGCCHEKNKIKTA